MRPKLLFLLLLLPQITVAEVFKCVGHYGAVSYQSNPCSAANAQQQLDIESDLDQEAAAKARLDEVRNEYATRKAAQSRADNLAAEQNYKAEALEISRNKVLALQELAAAKRLQAKAMKHQRRQQRPSPGRRGNRVRRKYW